MNVMPAEEEELSGPRFKKHKGTGSGFWNLNRVLFILVLVVGVILGILLTPLFEPFVYPEKARLEKDLQDYKLANQYYDQQVDCLVEKIESNSLTTKELESCGIQGSKAS